MRRGYEGEHLQARICKRNDWHRQTSDSHSFGKGCLYVCVPYMFRPRLTDEDC